MAQRGRLFAYHAYHRHVVVTVKTDQKCIGMLRFDVVGDIGFRCA